MIMGLSDHGNPSFVTQLTFCGILDSHACWNNKRLVMHDMPGDRPDSVSVTMQLEA